MRRGKVTRRLAGDEPEVNEEWSCDKGRFAFSYAVQPTASPHPLVRDAESGELVAASWPEALDAAARGSDGGPRAAGSGGAHRRAGDAWRTPTRTRKFARTVLGTNDIDFRARPRLRRGDVLPAPRTSPARASA